MGGMSLSLPSQVRVPSAAVVLDDWLDYAPKEDQWGRLLRRRRFDTATVDHWVFISEYTRERAQSQGYVFASSEVNPAGVGEEFLTAAPPREWSWRLLYVGRIDERKGIDTAIRALEHLPAEATLRVVGSGDEAAEQRLRALDAVLFPVRWREPWGVVPLEAMGVGRPVVATGRGGSGEYLRDGENALLFDADDEAALARQVTRLADDEGLRERLRAAGRATAEAHTAAAHDARVTAILEGLARG